MIVIAWVGQNDRGEMTMGNTKVTGVDVMVAIQYDQLKEKIKAEDKLSSVTILNVMTMPG